MVSVFKLVVTTLRFPFTDDHCRHLPPLFSGRDIDESVLKIFTELKWFRDLVRPKYSLHVYIRTSLNTSNSLLLQKKKK